MDQTTDQIKREIEEARERISERTTEIGERIRSTLDWRQQVADHPWVAVGMAAAAGFFAGAGMARAVGGARPREERPYAGMEREIEARAPAAGAEWPGAGMTGERGETPESRREAGTAGGAYRYGATRAGREERAGWTPSAGVAAALAAALGPQLQEIGRNFAEQLKDLSSHLIAQGKDYMKERVDEWRGAARRGGEGGPRRAGPTGGRGEPRATQATAGGPPPGGTTVSPEAAGGWPTGSTTGTGATAGTGAPSGGIGQVDPSHGGTPPGTEGARESRSPQGREREAGERRAGGS